MHIAEDRWLSEQFGWPVFTVTAEAAAELPDHAAAQTGRATYQAKVPALDVATLAALEQAGMRVVNLNLTLAREPGGLAGSDAEVREADAERDQELTGVAARAFRFSRFHLDPGVPPEVATRVKSEWVANYLRGARGERLLVGVLDGRPAGFLAELWNGDVAVIDLIGVDPSAQGRGLGRALVERFQADTQGRAERLEVGTQAANEGAVRFYELLGWTTTRAAYDLHMHVGAESLRIGPHDTDSGVLVIAELGNNHEGDPGVARELVERAADAGAHGVKLQTFVPELFVRARDTARLKQMSRFRLADSAVEELAALARERGMGFMSTPLDLASAEFLESIVDAYKVASGDNDFVPLLDKLAASGRPMVVSTGLLDLDGVKRLDARLADVRDLAYLHCVVAYPLSPEQANLNAIPLMAEELGRPVGWSNHVPGIEACLAAAAVGAQIVETHFTLDHHFSEFRDHQLSAEPDELRELVRRVAAPALPDGAETLLGERVKAVQPQERELEQAVRRSITAARDLDAGRELECSDLSWQRPRDGLEPGREAELVGRLLMRAVPGGDSILPQDLS